METLRNISPTPSLSYNYPSRHPQHPSRIDICTSMIQPGLSNSRLHHHLQGSSREWRVGGQTLSRNRYATWCPNGAGFTPHHSPQPIVYLTSCLPGWVGVLGRLHQPTYLGHGRVSKSKCKKRIRPMYQTSKPGVGSIQGQQMLTRG